MLFVWEGNSFKQKVWSLIRSQLSLPRFDLFLQGTLLILTLLDGYSYLLIRRSSRAGLFSPKYEEWVYMGSGGVEFLLGAILSWYGGRRRHHSLSMWLFVTSLCGLLVLVFPMPTVEVADVDLCNAVTTEAEGSVANTLNNRRTAMIVVTALLCSLARTSVWSHGITYLDDHDQKNGATYYGIQISIRISVGVNARNWLEGHSLGPEWWKAQLSLTMLTLMFSVLFALFPKRIEGWKIAEDEENFGDYSLIKTLRRIFKNKGLVIQMVALCLLNTAVWQFVHHEAEYVQGRYNINTSSVLTDGRTSRVVGDILRTFVIVFFVAVFRARFSARRPEGVKANTAAKVGGVIALLSAAIFAIIALLRCNTASIAGLDGDNARDVYVQPECSSSCGCQSQRYGFTPVCALDSLTTFYSPCHAGCSAYEDLNGFQLLQNCSCGGFERAVLGDCNFDSCRVSFSVYQILYVNVLAMSAASLLMQGMVMLRAVRPADKPASVGVALGLAAAATNVVGHLVYMFISDATCVFRDADRCLLHGGGVAPAVAASSAALALGSAALSLGAVAVLRPDAGTLS